MFSSKMSLFFRRRDVGRCRSMWWAGWDNVKVMCWKLTQNSGPFLVRYYLISKTWDHSNWFKLKKKFLAKRGEDIFLEWSKAISHSRGGGRARLEQALKQEAGFAGLSLCICLFLLPLHTGFLTLPCTYTPNSSIVRRSVFNRHRSASLDLNSKCPWNRFGPP